MKRLCAFAGATGLLTVGLGLGTTAPAFAAVTCNGFGITDRTIHENLVVPAGGQCAISESTIDGHVSVKPGGSLLVEASTITGNLVADQPNGSAPEQEGVTILDSEIRGSVSISGAQAASKNSGMCGTTVGGNFSYSASAPGSGFNVGTGTATGATCPTSSPIPNTVRGNVRFDDNQGAWNFSGNTANGNAEASGDTGGGTYAGNLIRGSLRCNNNNPPVTTSGNDVRGKSVC